MEQHSRQCFSVWQDAQGHIKVRLQSRLRCIPVKAIGDHAVQKIAFPLVVGGQRTGKKHDSLAQGVFDLLLSGFRGVDRFRHIGRY